MKAKKKKSVLGKGLGALIPKKSVKKSNIKTKNYRENEVIEIPLVEISANKGQPRILFETDKLNELSESIQQKGVLQPILVLKEKKGFKIIAGERRFRAAKLAGLSSIPAIIKSTDDQSSYEMALIENIQRENLNIIEEANAYQKLIENYDLTQDELSKRVSKSRSAISNTLRLLSLPMEIKEMVILKQLTMGHARALLSINNQEKQIELAKSCLEQNWYVRKIEQVVQDILNENLPVVEKDKSKEKAIDEGNSINKSGLMNIPEFKRYIERMEHLYGCRISINGTMESGNLQFQYRNGDELNYLLEELRALDSD